MTTGNDPYRLLFVCTGNICRSPMAEVIAISYAGERMRPVKVQSASTLGLDGRPADPKAVAVCKEIGLDLTQHRSQPLTGEIIGWAEHVLVMEYAHAQFIRENHPEVGDKLMLLGTFGGMLEIADPIGGWKFKFRRSRKDLQRCVEGFIDRLPPTKRTT